MIFFHSVISRKRYSNFQRSHIAQSRELEDIASEFRKRLGIDFFSKVALASRYKQECLFNFFLLVASEQAQDIKARDQLVSLQEAGSPAEIIRQGKKQTNPSCPELIEFAKRFQSEGDDRKQYVHFFLT